MLIFDNILFATFIPQILMLFGFVSCVVSSVLVSGDSATRANDTAHQADVINSSLENKEQAATYVFSDFSDSVQLDVFHRNEDKTENLFYFVTSQLKYPRINTPLWGKKANFFFFCRPPPANLLFG